MYLSDNSTHGSNNAGFYTLAGISYTLLMYLVLPFVMLYLLWRSRKDARYRQRWAERFGYQLSSAKSAGGLVIHAVSVGEVVAATPLIKKLMQHYPHLPLTVTCSTPTGSERITQLFGQRVQHCYLPVDTPGAVSRFLNKLQPQALIILETELWPNLLMQSRSALIPVIVVNARLSARSARGYKRWFVFSRLILKNISVLLSQDKATARRFRALGCSADIQVCGNLKFDMAVPDTIGDVVKQFTPILAQRQVWVAGSTHAGEDEMLIQAYLHLKPQWPDLLLILVPRHPERFNSVATLLADAGVHFCRRSSQDAISADTDVLLADTMGELLAWYQLATVVFIGGSLIARGGHNPLEAMHFAKPVQAGPHVFNFAQVYRALAQQQALCAVTDIASLVDSTTQLLSDNNKCAVLGAMSLQLYRQHSGASDNMLNAITTYLGPDIASFRSIDVSPASALGGQIIWYQQDVFENEQNVQFNVAHWQQHNAIIGQSEGRHTAWFAKVQQTKLVLRHYYRGGLVGKLLRDQFFYQPVLSSRAMQEFRLLAHMRRCQLPVPRPLAAKYQHNVLIYRADIMIELIAQSKDLATLLQSTALTDEQWQFIGSIIARFHQHGIYHSDLNCHNILLDNQNNIWLIDFDKCALRNAGDWQKNNLNRLLRSFKKEQKKSPSFHWQHEHWQALLAGYKKQFNCQN